MRRAAPIISIVAEGPDTIRALYSLKPKLGLLGPIWIPDDPSLAPDAVNTVTVKPLSSFIEGFPRSSVCSDGASAPWGSTIVPD